MEHYVNRLSAAMQSRERIQELLSNIEQRKAAGTLAAGQYELLKADYQQKMAAAVSELSAVKGEIKSMLQALKDRVSSLERETEGLRARLAAGEFTVKQYQAAERKLLRQLAAVKKGIPRLQMLADLKSSSQLAGTPVSGKRSFPQWAIAVVSIVATLILVGGGGFAVYKYVLEPGGFKIPFLTAPADNATLAPQVSENSTNTPASPDTGSAPPVTPGENTTVAALTWPEIIAGAEKSVVAVRSMDLTGAGILVSGNGRVLTSKHNIPVRAPFTVETYDRVQRKAIVVDSGNDLILVNISPENVSTPFIKVGDSAGIKKGDEIAVLNLGGCPVGVTSSRLASVVNLTEDGIMHIGIEYSPCYAGSAVIDKNGELIGLIVGPVAPVSGQSVMFAVPVNSIKAWLANSAHK